MSTRRQFLAVTSATVVVSTLPRDAFASLLEDEVFSNRNLGAYSQGLLTFERLQPLVGSEFRVFLADGSVAHLTLTAVVDRTASATSASQQGVSSRSGAVAVRSPLRNPAAASPTAFDLEFSSNGTVLEQKSYTVDHARLGRFVVFLVPGRSPNGAPSCSSSFNYLSGATAASGPAGGHLISQP